MLNELETSLAGYLDELVSACDRQTARLEQLAICLTEMEARLSRLENQLAPFGISTRPR